MAVSYTHLFHYFIADAASVSRSKLTNLMDMYAASFFHILKIHLDHKMIFTHDFQEVFILLLCKGMNQFAIWSFRFFFQPIRCV